MLRIKLHNVVGQKDSPKRVICLRGQEEAYLGYFKNAKRQKANGKVEVGEPVNQTSERQRELALLIVLHFL